MESYNPEFGYYSNTKDLIPDYSQIGYAYCSINAFPNRDFINNASVPYTDLLIKTDRKDMVKLEEDISNALSGRYIAFITRSDFTGVSTLDAEVQQHKAMGNVFPIAFAAIALLSIITTMSRLVNQQRTQIGTLKALGFSQKKIIRHYLTYGFFLSLLGSFFGSIIGVHTLPHLFYPSMSTYYTLPEWKPAISPIFLLAPLITTLACTAATYFSCHKLVGDTPAQTLRPKAPESIKHTALEKGKLWERLSFRTKWNLRDIVRSKARIIMGFIGTMSCMALLICAFAMNDTMNDIKTWMYHEIQHYNTQIFGRKNR
jgi:putative ABC transport system permease protein